MAELKVSVCQPLTTTMARSIKAKSAEPSTNGSASAGFCGWGLRTKKSMSSSSSRRVWPTYLRCWRTRNSCSSKYSRTMVSLTADMLGVPGRRLRVEGLGDHRQRDLVAEFDRADAPCEHELDLAVADLLVELHGGEELLLCRRV